MDLGMAFAFDSVQQGFGFPSVRPPAASSRDWPHPNTRAHALSHEGRRLMRGIAGNK